MDNEIRFNLKDPICSVEGFPNYFVSANGIVYSCVQTNKAFMSGGLYKIEPKEHNRGYLEVGLFGRDSKGKAIRRWFRIHRLVADAFIPKPLPTYDAEDNEVPLEVNHINGNKKDNRVENLEWMTRSENITHAYVVLGRENVTRPIYYDGVKYNSIKECAMVNGFNHHSLCSILSQKKDKYKKKPISYATDALVNNNIENLINHAKKNK
jgi:hypothetical protein